MTPRYAVLIGQLQQFLTDLEQVAERNQRLLQKYNATQDEDYVGTLALNLHGFYTGIERCFEEIARQLDETVPSGTDWHRVVYCGKCQLNSLIYVHLQFKQQPAKRSMNTVPFAT
jgi:hypothetical protein